MRKECYFIDTSFVLALVNKNDIYYEQANKWLSKLRKTEFWISDAIILEIGNSLSRTYRETAVLFIRNCYESENMNVAGVNQDLIEEALNMYEDYSDKYWGLVDCTSFLIMKKNRIKKVLTTDNHFIQAGFEVCL